MAVLYHVSLDESIYFDLDVKEIQEAFDKISEENEEKLFGQMLEVKIPDSS